MLSPGIADAGATEASSVWFARPMARTPSRLRLFCFPYGGSDALTVYRRWHAALPNTIEVSPVLLPGRGARIIESPFSTLTPMVAAIGDAMADRLDKPFAFFGHSMGAMIAFELARFLRKKHGVQPVHLFLSARAAPQFQANSKQTYNLPDREFIEELQRMNGTPNEILEHPELMKVMIPIMRADFQVCQTHAYETEPPLGCPISVFGGLQDSFTREELEGWRDYTTARFSLHMFPGDHFFIRPGESTLLRLILANLQEAVSRP